MARQPFISVEPDFDAGVLRINFPSLGNTVEVQVDDLDAEIRRRLVFHGLEQKLRDAVATPDEPEKRFTRFERVLSALLAGSWTVGRAPGEPAETPIDRLARAVANVLTAQGQPADFESIRAKLAAMDRKSRNKVRSVPEVAAELARLSGGASLADLL